MKTGIIIIAALLTGCVAAADRAESTRLDSEAAAQLDKDIADNRLTCATDDQCDKLWNTAKSWIAARPHDYGVKVRGLRVTIERVEGPKLVTLQLSLEGTGADRFLKVDASCSNFSLVLVPLSCGSDDEHLEVQAEREIRAAL